MGRCGLLGQASSEAGCATLAAIAAPRAAARVGGAGLARRGEVPQAAALYLTEATAQRGHCLASAHPQRDLHTRAWGATRSGGRRLTQRLGVAPGRQGWDPRDCGSALQPRGPPCASVRAASSRGAGWLCRCQLCRCQADRVDGAARAAALWVHGEGGEEDSSVASLGRALCESRYLAHLVRITSAVSTVSVVVRRLVLGSS